MGDQQYTNDSMYRDVCNAMSSYSSNGNFRIDKKLSNFRKLPIYQQDYLKDAFYERVEESRNALQANQAFLNNAREISEEMFQVSENKPTSYPQSANPKFLDSILRQVYREWSVEAVEDRRTCFDPILDVFRQIYDENLRPDLVVLVPGAGIGRLVYELAKTGCQCVYNDSDMYSIIISYGFMNNKYQKHEFQIYPWVNVWSNNYNNSSAMKPVTVPDIILDTDVNMRAEVGDFLACFKDDSFERFDCVVTCFFIDTMPNIINCIERIQYVLKRGGKWINLGPLSYHYEDDAKSVHIEPTFEEIQHVILNCLNFQVVKENTFIDCLYSDTKCLMNRNFYNCPFFVVQKPF
ncbi:UPF0586 protein C9orf41 [Thelohanellus kitauei]|uniref:carnosine N-methyltransferase n=1 Tax=Thelohanellus kitauei TaxID=669202 RepID=A0A0C2MIB3_THEKT|nr:UPF0586 protein C9orf41 [Thelohanellus kitauei]